MLQVKTLEIKFVQIHKFVIMNKTEDNSFEQVWPFHSLPQTNAPKSEAMKHNFCILEVIISCT